MWTLLLCFLPGLFCLVAGLLLLFYRYRILISIEKSSLSKEDIEYSPHARSLRWARNIPYVIGIYFVLLGIVFLVFAILFIRILYLVPNS